MKQAKRAKKRDLTDPTLRGYKFITPKEVRSVPDLGAHVASGGGVGN